MKKESWITKKGFFLTIGHLFWISLGYIACVEIPCQDEGLFAGTVPPLVYIILTVGEGLLFLYYIAPEIRRKLGFEILFGFLGFSPIIPFLIYVYLAFHREHCGVFY